MDKEQFDQDVKTKHDVETSAEISPAQDSYRRSEKEGGQQTTDTGKVFGYIALILSVASFFFAPILVGAAGIVFGVLAKRKGADTLGNIALIVSILAIVISLFTAPYV
ncbi:hypothetical protein SAMN05421663_107231 [Terribacillus halophilus]|uniref:DUF4190 domain-containing protein n=1 Tax=Terribacillus halophilus TaxID=361279 RepID=A0A1G6SUT9_9BACI|nr:hypothetical protein [Terribacillus halophilus]SDD19967.1 hypothetical protein SAMN05421663_107231 [Terribacillus halophilus]